MLYKKTKNGNSTRLSPDKLVEAVTDLLKILIDEDTLQLFGWPEAPVQDILEAVIRRCGHQPLTSESNLLFNERLRENIKRLFMVVIEDNTVKCLLTTSTIDDVIIHVLQLSKESTANS